MGKMSACGSFSRAFLCHGRCFTRMCGGRIGASDCCSPSRHYATINQLSSDWGTVQLLNGVPIKGITGVRFKRVEQISVVHRNLCYPAHSATLDMSKFSDTNSLLETFTKHAASGSVTVHNIAEALNTLHHLAYERLGSLPWLHNHNGSIAYMQLLMNDVLADSMSQILEHPGFTKLLEMTESNAHMMNSEELCSCLLASMWMGVDKPHPAIRRMFLELHDHVDEIDLAGLLRISDCLRALRRTDILLLGKVTRSFVYLLDQLETKPLSESDFSVISKVGTNIWACLSEASMVKLSKMTSDWLLNADMVSDIQSLSAYSRLAKRLRTSKFRTVEIPIEKLEDLIIKFKHKILPQHIAEISHSLKTSSLYTPGIANTLQARSLELLQTGELSRIGEITNACYSLYRNLPHMDKRLVEDTIYRHMQDADVLVLSNLADILADIDCRNHDIIYKFSSLVEKHMQQILLFVTRLSKILRFLNMPQCQKVSHTDVLYQSIFHQLHHQQGLHVWSIANLSSFLLRHVGDIIPQMLYERLLAAIPQCDIAELQTIMLGLSKIRRPRIRTLQSQIQQLYSLIYQNIGYQVDRISSLDTLHQMVVSLCLRSEVKDIELVDLLMDQYPKFTKTLNEGTFMKSLNVLNQLVYYSPRILDDLVRYGVGNVKSLGIDRFTYLLKTLANTGYVPSDADLFTQILVKLFEDSGDVLDLPDKLRFVLDLCKLQIFPESILNSVFTVEFIEEVDKYINDHDEYRDVLERTFMELNRCMVLECPSLDIPWFHEQYCLDNLLSAPVSRMKVSGFTSDVEAVLREVLGGNKYFGVLRHTKHYFYPLDFECLLNSSGKAVVYSESNIDQCEELGLQKVTISTLYSHQYCRNERRLIGSEQMKKRHLEIMGYKVVQVPIFEWRSMALTDHPAKQEYLRQKIFSV